MGKALRKERETERQRDRQRDREREENLVYFGLCVSFVHFYRREDHINAVYAK